jgi:uncharacterized protein DUF5677
LGGPGPAWNRPQYPYTRAVLASDAYEQAIAEVLALTEPPDDQELEDQGTAIAAGLLMRARMLLRATAVLGDRMLGGAADPLVRSIVEICFTAGWLLQGSDADVDTYLGDFRRQWAIAARQQQALPRNKASDSVAGQLDPFLSALKEGFPGDARLPTLEERAKRSGFGGFYQLYRILTRLVHPELAAANSGLVEVVETGEVIVNASPTVTRLSASFVELGIYLVAKLGQQVDEALSWGRAEELAAMQQGHLEAAMRSFED